LPAIRWLMASITTRLVIAGCYVIARPHWPRFVIYWILLRHYYIPLYIVTPAGCAITVLREPLRWSTITPLRDGHYGYAITLHCHILRRYAILLPLLRYIARHYGAVVGAIITPPLGYVVLPLLRRHYAITKIRHYTWLLILRHLCGAPPSVDTHCYMPTLRHMLHSAITHMPYIRYDKVVAPYMAILLPYITKMTLQRHYCHALHITMSYIMSAVAYGCLPHDGLFTPRHYYAAMPPATCRHYAILPLATYDAITPLCDAMMLRLHYWLFTCCHCWSLLCYDAIIIIAIIEMALWLLLSHYYYAVIINIVIVHWLLILRLFIIEPYVIGYAMAVGWSLR